ncbi:MAG TPA: hypothetical protein VF624_16480 [Tepidisphaeraceae bacterium]
MLKKFIIVAAACGLALGTVACKSKPRERPPVDELADEGRGLQGKDVISASDRMAQELLSDPDLNASQSQYVIVVDRMENLTQTQRGRLDVFLDRVGVRLSRLGRGRVTLVSRRAALQSVQSRERDDVGGSDRFGQGSGTRGGLPGRLQPDFALKATVSELPNKSTSYFYVGFELVNLVTGVQVWQGDYEVATNR